MLNTGSPQAATTGDVETAAFASEKTIGDLLLDSLHKNHKNGHRGKTCFCGLHDILRNRSSSPPPHKVPLKTESRVWHLTWTMVNTI